MINQGAKSMIMECDCGKTYTGGTVADEEEEECLFCKQYAFEMARDELLEMQECTNTDPCHDYDECAWCCQHVKPCECGCGFLGGTCNGEEEEEEMSEYMMELMSCGICKQDDIPRYLLHWTPGGGSYTDICEKCILGKP